MALQGSAVTTAGMHCRHVSGTSGTGSGSVEGSRAGSNMLRFYTDDTPGLKISPIVVLVSLWFISFVTALHVFGKLYRYKSSA